MTQYSGKVIRKTPVTPTQTSASGVWTTADAAAAVRNNLWPVPGVPDPISRSVRFRSSASAYFSRTFGTPTNNLKWTWSGWVKRGKLGTAQTILGGAAAGTGQFPLYFTANDQLAFYDSDGVSTYYQIGTTAVFRDPSAWYHIVIVFDSANATQANRLIIYVNNVSQALSSIGGSPGGLLPLNRASYWNASGAANNIGCYYTSSTANNPLDGYITESVLVDGQALTPSSFGTTDTATGAWIPMPYTGTYGTNGFYLNFKDNTSTTTIGYDYSGNSNNWTANNISLTAGSTYDSMLDVPTPWVGYNTGDTTAVTRGNYAVLSPLSTYNGGGTLSNANLNVSLGTVANNKPTFGALTGKFYAEFTCVSAGGYSGTGLSITSAGPASDPEFMRCAYYSNGQTYNYNTSAFVSYGASWTSNDVIGVAFDCDNKTVEFFKNGVSQGVLTTPSIGTNANWTQPVAFIPSAYNTGVTTSFAVNYGQRPFTYTPPSGYKTLCTTNLPTPTITNGATVMAATTYTGTGSTQNILNSGNNSAAVSFKPDFVWIKNRSSVNSHQLTDSVRGVNLALASDLTIAEYAGNMNAFNSNGFQVTSSANAVNNTGQTYIGWQWQAGQGTTSSNTSGSITSTVSVNTTAGFSVVTWTNTTFTNATVGHGLGASPSLIITKSRNNTSGWLTWHSGIGSTQYLLLQTTGAAVTNSSAFNGVSSTTFTLGDNSAWGVSGYTYVAYCWTPIAGYSAFGSYTGNGSTDGPFIYCGFRPRFVLVKCSGTTSNWFIFDSSRDTYNVMGNVLMPQASNAEFSVSPAIDFTSNGFKLRGNTDANVNGLTMIYAAFAETPFKYSNAR